MKFDETRSILNGKTQALNSTRLGRGCFTTTYYRFIYHQISYFNIINYSRNHDGINFQIYQIVNTDSPDADP
jgi:hypothetical protein